ncbi:MAG: cytochrome D1 domain-containing protein [Verrucomicrobiota bacterium]
MKKIPLIRAGLTFLLGVLYIEASTSKAEMLLVANKGDKTVSLVDPTSEMQIAKIAENAVTAHELIASPDGKLAYVPIYGNSGVGKPGTDGQLIRIMDLESRSIVGTIDFGKGIRPHCPLFGPKDGLLYVTTELQQSVTVIDPKTLAIIGSIPTGKNESHMLVLSHDGHRGYTANVRSGTISVLNLDKRTLEQVVQVAPVIQRIAVTMDDRFIITADQTALRLAVIDAETLKIVKSVALPGLAYGTAVTPDGKSLVVAIPGAQKAGLVDLATMRLIKTLPMPKSPQEVLVRPDGLVAYVSCDSSAQVAEIDLEHFTLKKLIKVGAGDDGLAWVK